MRKVEFKIAEYDKLKHRSKLISYLKKIEKKFEYIPYIFSIDMIEVLSSFKNVFVVIENAEIINLGYKNKIKSNVGFFFEKPKNNYDFLNNFDSIAVLFCPKKEIDKIEYEDKIEVSEAIVNMPNVLSLSGSGFKTLRGKINKFKKENPDFIVEVFDKEKINYNELKAFYDEWGKSSEDRIPLYMCLYENYQKFIYEFNGNLEGIVIRNNGKIIGVGFFSISPLRNQSVGISCNGFCKFKGLNEFLAYERFKFVYTKYKTKFMNIGSAESEEIIAMKKKFCFLRQKFFVLVLKGNNLRKKGFWYDDCLDPDDFGS